MFENIMNFFKNWNKKENKEIGNSKNAAKERLHLVLMQDRANVSADFLELMKQEIIEVIKKYIDVDESAIDVRLTNKENGDGTNGAPALYANIPILNIKNEARKVNIKEENKKVEEVAESKEKVKKVEEKTSQKDDKEENKNETVNEIEEVEENKEETEEKSKEKDDKNENDEETKVNKEVKSENK